MFPGHTTRLRWSFGDPSRATGAEDGRLDTFRRVWNDIRTRLRKWLATAT